MKLLVYGSGEFGRVVSALATTCGHQFVGYIDDHHQREGVIGTYASCRTSHPPSEYAIALAIGYRWMQQRLTVFNKLKFDGYSTPSLIHPTSHVAESAQVGHATLVMATAVIDTLAVVNTLCVVWPGAIINHEARLAENIFVGPNATLCGACHIGSNSFLGAGTVIIDHVNVPESTFVKAGTIFTRKSKARHFDERRDW